MAASTANGTFTYWHQGLPSLASGAATGTVVYWHQGLPLTENTTPSGGAGPSVDTFAAILMTVGAIERSRPATRVVSY